MISCFNLLNEIFSPLSNEISFSAIETGNFIRQGIEIKYGLLL